MSAYKILELKSKDAITRTTSFVFTDNWNDVSCLIKFSNALLKELNIKEEEFHSLRLDQFTTSKIPSMNLPEITAQNGN